MTTTTPTILCNTHHLNGFNNVQATSFMPFIFTALEYKNTTYTFQREHVLCFRENPSVLSFTMQWIHSDHAHLMSHPECVALVRTNTSKYPH